MFSCLANSCEKYNNGKPWQHNLFVTGLGKQKIILGFPWFKTENPDIDWDKGTLTWQELKKNTQNNSKPIVEEEKDKEEWKTWILNPIDHNNDNVLISYLKEMEEEIWINAKTNMAMELAIKENEKKPDASAKGLVLEDLHDFLDVFNEEWAGRLPKSQPWDHKIEMKEGFELKSFKNYNLTLAEQIKLDKFLKENLDKGYICPSQSPMASPFFFVNKKDGKLQPCQDYRYINDWTIKNAYPWPLISEIMDKLKRAKYFTKMDIWWGYNNVQIREGDEWKAAFKTNQGP